MGRFLRTLKLHLIYVNLVFVHEAQLLDQATPRAVHDCEEVPERIRRFFQLNFHLSNVAQKHGVLIIDLSVKSVSG